MSGFPWNFKDILASADLNAAFNSLIALIKGASDTANAASSTATNALASVNGKLTSVNGKTGPAVTLGAADVFAIPAALTGVANGVPNLGADGKVPTAQLPAFGTVTSVNTKTPVSGAVTLSPGDIGAVSAATLGATNGTATLGADSKLTDSQIPSTLVRSSAIGVANGIAPLGADGKIPAAQLPSSASGQTGVTSFVRPAISAFSLNDLTDSFVLSFTPQLSSSAVAYASFAKASTANTLIVCFEWDFVAGTNRGDFYLGVVAINTAGGKAQTWYASDTGQLNREASNSLTAWSAYDASTMSGTQAGRTRQWMKIESIQSPSSTRLISLSANGRDWSPAYRDPAEVATFDQLGLIMRYSGGDATVFGTGRLLHWVES
jgi:hypothetical protein